MTRTRAPNARIVPLIRGKPVTWLTPLPPNRGPTDADKRSAAALQMEGERSPLRRGTDPAFRRNTARRGREPTTDLTIEHRIRGPNLITNVHSREGPMTGRDFSRPRCRGDTRAGDIGTIVFTCGSRYFGREADAAG